MNDLGFLWGMKARTQPNVKRKFNRAVAAKLVYPQLTYREALYLGGFVDEELDMAKNEKYTWRTEYYVQKLNIIRKLKDYPNARRVGSRMDIEALVDVLEGDGEDKLAKVFEDRAAMLKEFLEAAEERKREGTDPDLVRANRTLGLADIEVDGEEAFLPCSKSRRIEPPEHESHCHYAQHLPFSSNDEASEL